MPGLDVGDIVELRFHGQSYGNLVLNVLHYKCTTAGVGSVSVVDDLDKFLNALDTDANSVYQKWRLCVPTNTTIEVMEAQRVQPARSVKRVFVPSNVVPGRGGSSTANLSAVITKGTDIGARGQTGSLHLPGVADGDQVAAELAPALITAMAVLGQTMLLPVTVAATGLTVTPVLYHPPVKADPDHVPPIPARAYSSTVLTRAVPQSQVRVMRRRTTGVGR